MALPIHDYELMYIVRPDADDEKQATTIAALATAVTIRGGTITTDTNWGRKRLAYPIQDFREGIYVIYEFKFDADQVAPLDRQIRLNEDVIRHMILRIERKAPRARKGAASAAALVETPVEETSAESATQNGPVASPVEE